MNYVTVAFKKRPWTFLVAFTLIVHLYAPCAVTFGQHVKQDISNGGKRYKCARNFESLSKVTHDKSADLIVYSFDRPLQLWAFLESVEEFVKGLHKVSIIYRSSTPAFDSTYAELKRKFNTAIFLQQSTQAPPEDFKELTLKALTSSHAGYVLFAVDDIIVKDIIDVDACRSILEKTHAYGVYLRLGLNVSECYMQRSYQGIPPYVYLGGEFYAWKFSSGKGDWHYPHTLDMTLYRTRDIIGYFTKLDYTSPNTLESIWAEYADMSRIGICCKSSKVINIPLNRVQHDFVHNRHMDMWSPEQLLVKFDQGFVIDRAPLYAINNTSAHMCYKPSFKRR